MKAKVRKSLVILAWVLVCLGILWLFASPLMAAPLMTYHIGNSLTWDHQPNREDTVELHTGLAHDAGTHINCGKPLSHIAANPSQTCVSTQGFGTYDQALVNNTWDIVTAQAYPADNGTDLVGPSTIGTDETAILGFQALQPGADWYLVEGWPVMDPDPDPEVARDFTAAEWLARWDAPFVDDDSSLTELSAGFHDALYARVKQSDPNIKAIPTARVLAEILRRHGDDFLPGSNFGQTWYRDRNHLSRDIGRVMSHMTMWSVMHKADPQVLDDLDYSQFNADVNRITPAMQQEIAEIVWDVVRADERTGVVANAGDLDLDGFVGQADLDFVLTRWGLTGQGQMDTVLLNWGNTYTTEGVGNPVPEPTTAALVGLGALLMLRRKA